MKAHELTDRAVPAKSLSMETIVIRKPWTGSGRAAAAALALGGAGLTGGCVSVNAPDKPIVIELNINIKQEVVYRLSADAKGTIEGNPDAF